MSEYSQSIINALEKTGEIAFVPKGMSMYPFIKGGKQSVIVKKFQDGIEIEKFSVILYVRENQSLVLHRVINFDNGEYVVCGDGQFSFERVKREQIIGVMVGFYKGKTLIKANDEKYIKDVKKWYKKSKFYKRLRLKLARIFSKEI